MRVQACCSIGWRMSSRKPEPLPANDQPLVGPLLQNRQQNAAQAENSAAQLFLLTAPSLTPLPQRPSCSFFRLFPCSPALPSRAAPLLLSLSPVPLLTCSPVLAQRPSCSFFRLFPCSPVLLFSRSAPPPLSFPRKRESIFSSSSRPMHFFLSNLKLQICYSSSFSCSPAHLFSRSAPLALSFACSPAHLLSPLAPRPSCSFFRLFPCSPVPLLSRRAPPQTPLKTRQNHLDLRQNPRTFRQNALTLSQKKPKKDKKKAREDDFSLSLSPKGGGKWCLYYNPYFPHRARGFLKIILLLF